MEHIRYSAACCQTDLPNPIERRAMRANTDRMLSMIDSAVAGAAPFLPVRLVVFPEFAHSAPVFETVAELIEKLAIEIPNEHTERLAQKAREYDIYVQSGSMLEVDPKWPGHVFNTTCLIGPNGILYRYRKVNTWIPYEVHTSPHDLEGYDEPLFPVAKGVRLLGISLSSLVAEEAARKAAMLKVSFDAAPEAVELPPGIGLSVGWAEVPPDTDDLLPLVKEADQRMYADKGHAATPTPVAAQRSAGGRPRRTRKV
jgi:hypothetical protein